MNDLNMRIAKAKGWSEAFRDKYGNEWGVAPNNIWGGGIIRLDDYSLIQNAMELMEEIWEEHRAAIIRLYGLSPYISYCVDVDRLGMEKPYGIGESLPRAICLAWLEIFEKEEK